MMLAIALASIFVYMVLVAQFESFVQPLIIMTALPLSVPFALLTLAMTGRALNLWSTLGILLLLGIVKKNSILQVDYTNVLRKRGMPLDAALLEASRTRLRPILMTTTAIIAGLIPTAFGAGAGARQRGDIAVTIIGGQTLCLFLTLLLVPVAYSLVEDARTRLQGARIGAVAARWTKLTAVGRALTENGARLRRMRDSCVGSDCAGVMMLPRVRSFIVVHRRAGVDRRCGLLLYARWTEPLLEAAAATAAGDSARALQAYQGSTARFTDMPVTQQILARDFARCHPQPTRAALSRRATTTPCSRPPIRRRQRLRPHFWAGCALFAKSGTGREGGRAAGMAQSRQGHVQDGARSRPRTTGTRNTTTSCPPAWSRRCAPSPNRCRRRSCSCCDRRKKGRCASR